MAEGPGAWIARPLAFATGAVCLATLLAFGGRWSWACDLLTNFRTHYVLLLVPATLVALALRQWRIAGVALAGLALNLWPLHRAYLATGASSVPDARAVRVASFNIHISNDDVPGIAAYLESEEVDVVVFQEMSRANSIRLAPLLPRLPHRYVAGDDGVRGVMILSRWPLIDPRPAVRDGLPFAATADVDLGDRRFRLHGAHLSWPLTPGSAGARNAQLRALAQELAECPHACVVVGDFNVTPWSSHFRDVLRTPGVHDCAAGRGLLATWSSDLPAVARIRIDHCLRAGALGVAGVRVGQNLGSDHFAVINDLLIGVR